MIPNNVKQSRWLPRVSEPSFTLSFVSYDVLSTVLSIYYPSHARLALNCLEAPSTIDFGALVSGGLGHCARWQTHQRPESLSLWLCDSEDTAIEEIL